jgi:hypothetical protein
LMPRTATTRAAPASLTASSAAAIAARWQAAARAVVRGARARRAPAARSIQGTNPSSVSARSSPPVARDLGPTKHCTGS